MNAAIDLDSAITELAQEYARLIEVSQEEAWPVIAELVRGYGLETIRTSVMGYAEMWAKVGNRVQRGAA